MAVLSQVQRGQITLSGTLTTVSVAVATVDTTKTVLLFDTTGPGNAAPSGELVRGQLTSATQIDFVRVGGTTCTTRLTWQLVSFHSGVTVQRGTTSVGSAVDVAITPADPGKSFPLHTWARSGTVYNGDDAGMVRLTSSATLVFEQSSATVGVNDWQVVTYDNCSVKTGTVSLTALATSAVASLTATVSLDRSVLLISHYYAAGVTAAQAGVKGALSATGITFSRDASGVLVRVRWHVVSFTDADVQAGIVTFGSLSGTTTVTLAPSVNTARAVSLDPYQGNQSGTSSNNTDDNMQSASFRGSLSSTSIVVTRGTTGPAASVPWFVLSWPAQTLDGTLTESLVLVDTLTASATYSGTLTESVVPADTLTVSATLSAAVSETTALAETLTVSATLSGTLSDDIALTGTLTVSATLSGALSDDVVVAEVLDETLSATSTTTPTATADVIGRRRRTRGYRRKLYAYVDPVASPTLKPFAPPEPAPEFTLGKLLPKDPVYRPAARVDLSKLEKAVDRLVEQDDEEAFLLLF